MGSLKAGSLYDKEFAARHKAMDEVIDWLAFYNHRRLQAALGGVSPRELEENWHPDQPKKVAGAGNTRRSGPRHRLAKGRATSAHGSFVIRRLTVATCAES